MLDEYCRCGGPKQYRECHYPEDRQRTSYERRLQRVDRCRLVPVGGKASGLDDDATLGAVRHRLRQPWGRAEHPLASPSSA